DVNARIRLEPLRQIFALNSGGRGTLNIYLQLSRQQFDKRSDYVLEVFMLIGGDHYLEPPAVISVAWLRALAALFHQSLVRFPTDVVENDLLGHLLWRSQNCCHANSPGDSMNQRRP